MRRRFAGVFAALGRTFGFTTRRGVINATVVVALVCGLVSLLRGQDANWDLRNYHVYNGWALLEGRLGLDLAPAQMQSYFVPLLDVPYFLLVQHAPAPLAGFLLGLLHGLVFLPVAWIAWRALAGDPRRDWLAPVLGLAGLASAAFLSELGNTMGDNSTAPLVLGALALTMPDEDGRWRTRAVVAAGVLLGMAVAFKLTNAIYAFALGLSVLAARAHWRARTGAGAGLALVALLVFALMAGPWLYRLWETFGNPLFPQFNASFQAPLAQPVAVADTRWLPQGWVEALLRPLLFTANPYLVSEIALLQVMWALLYVVAITAAVVWLARRRRASAAAASVPAGAGVRRMLGVFFLVAFVAWLSMFSIHRYLVVLELLAPLVLWLLLHAVFPPRRAGRIAAIAIAAASAVALAGWNDWGHAGWSRTAFRVEAPTAAMPGTVLLVGGEPQAWRVPFLPPGPAYASLGSNFPESPAYADRVTGMIQARGGEVGVILPVAMDRRAESLGRRNRWAGTLGLDTGDCRVMRWLVGRSRSLVLVEPAQSPGGRCELAQAAGRRVDTANANQAILDEATTVLARYGLQLDGAGCKVVDSRIGAQSHPYHWCRAVPLPG
ncbi:glycosyltransferase 87 family protein [Pseudoxanthomonas daejeonensis]|uniref:glycosyltransferase 87 family protein n=1 Tax=Pseudoxanthomonas daejeonensis TaxID=266062 RepID=UPI001390BDE4|nr:glycosyltransferase 87 family protein [Pseudoxanthomonas daejeonensis]